MRVRIRTRRLEVSPDGRADLERRLRLLLGRDSVGIELADVLLESRPADQPTAPAGGQTSERDRDEIRCRIRTRLREGDALEVDDQAPDLDDAVFAAVWRLQHRLHRVRLQGARGEPDDERHRLPRSERGTL
jgi:hypothetical protein